MSLEWKDFVQYGEYKVHPHALELKELVEKTITDRGLFFEPNENEIKSRANSKQDDHNCFQTFDVFHESQPELKIGFIGARMWNDKYLVGSANITNGVGHDWRSKVQQKESKHIKKILKVVKDTMHPYTLDQIMGEHDQQFKREVDNFKGGWQYSFNVATHITNENYFLELDNMIQQGYKPLTDSMKSTLEYVRQNKDDLLEKINFNPNYTFVWLGTKSVQFKRISDTQTSIVNTRDELPDEVKGKMAVLDLSDPKEFMNGIGFRENKNAYWVLHE